MTIGSHITLIGPATPREVASKSERGWICPRCDRVNSPSVHQCDCPAEDKTQFLGINAIDHVLGDQCVARVGLTGYSETT